MLKQVIDTVRGGGGGRPAAAVDWVGLATALAPLALEMMRGRKPEVPAELVQELRALRDAVRPALAGRSDLREIVQELRQELRDDDAGEDGEGGETMTKGMRFLLELIGKAVDHKPALPPAEGEPVTMEALGAALVQRLRTAAQTRGDPSQVGKALALDVPAAYRTMLRGLLAGPQVREYLTAVAPDLLAPELMPWTADVLEAVKGEL
jgi:hypothetical protein